MASRGSRKWFLLGAGGRGGDRGIRSVCQELETRCVSCPPRRARRGNVLRLGNGYVVRCMRKCVRDFGLPGGASVSEQDFGSKLLTTTNGRGGGALRSVERSMLVTCGGSNVQSVAQPKDVPLLTPLRALRGGRRDVSQPSTSRDGPRRCLFFPRFSTDHKELDIAKLLNTATSRLHRAPVTVRSVKSTTSISLSCTGWPKRREERACLDRPPLGHTLLPCVSLNCA